ncbi:hypothetical protein SBOR_7814 [Sclerotinia borealis F-4128]|uniref:Uncharacterized protein n=1 Tax=Sclerotinia borealis (strain F-4128) TaxID=1432307 RepID=W9C7R7_SCLBF|nr:hypothetical protein SBOR_7814 [Sclerotinia borealis F-4128]
MNSKHGYGEWEFPKFKEARQFPNFPSAKYPMKGSSIEKNEFWSVKFYPYTKPDVDPVYAVVGGKHILICRPPTEDKGIETIQFIVDEEPSADHYSCCWTKDLATNKPLLCVAGVDPKIKIFDVLSGKLIRVLTGHGGVFLPNHIDLDSQGLIKFQDIDELVISPTNPHILASGSADSTVRIWSLDPENEQFPCAAILSGGHTSAVSTISFHHSGRYLLSGGEDHVISLWALPDFPDKNTGTDIATQIQYPHFSSSEIHTASVDCVCFYEDSILSRSANEECIVLWEITGFDSKGLIPDHDKAPTQYEAANGSLTLTCFTDPTKFESYIRLIEFSAPETETFWMRFSLFQGLPIPEPPSYKSPYPDLNSHESPNSSTHRTHPILAIGSHTSKIYFWDLTRLESYFDYVRSLPTSLTCKNDPVPDPSHSTIIGLTSDRQSPVSDDHDTQQKRPPFLTPSRPRGSRGGTGGAGIGKGFHSRFRDVSPASSSTSTTITMSSSNTFGSGPGHGHGHGHGLSLVPGHFLVNGFGNSNSNANTNANGNSNSNPDKIQITRSDIKLWNEKYNLNQRVKAHKEEVVRGWRFLGRGVAWSVGGEWCVVVGGEGVVGVLGRWGEGR